MDDTQETLLKQELTRDEARRSKVYKDSEGNDTVGIGHLVSKGFSDQVIDLIYKNDITEAEAFLNRNCPWWTTLSPIRQRVMLNMAFNMGARLLGFKKMLFAAQAGQCDVAAAEMEDSIWFKQVGKRAKRLQYMMKNNAVPPNTPEYF